MILVALSGFAQTGKDSTADILVERHGFQRRAFADKLRDAVYALDPIVGSCDCHAVESCPSSRTYADVIDEHGYELARKTEYGPEIRRLLQRMGTEVGRCMFGEDVWVNLALADLDPDGRYVFTDARFPNEAHAVTTAGGEVWRITRPGVGPVNDHESETGLDDWLFDRYIDNNGDLDRLAWRVDFAVDYHRQGTPS